MAIEVITPPSVEGLPDRSIVHCTVCNAEFDAGFQVYIDSRIRGFTDPYGKTRLSEDRSYPGDTSTHSQLRAFLEKHHECSERPEEISISERGIKIVDRRRFK